ncbi:MAG: DinB family protein [Bacteroidota bacterium]
METGQQLAARLCDLLLDGRWIANTNYQEQLADLSWKEATQQIRSLNSLAALTFHVDYYLAGIIQVFEGGELSIRDKYSYDLPPIQSQQDWEALRQQFLDNAQKFVEYVADMAAEQLAAPFVMAQYGDFRRNIEGVIEHAYYHFGQLVIIKKMIREGE